MKKITFLFSLLIFITQLTYAQTPTLVVDYILGPQGSIDNRISEFQNTLTYLGTNQNGERAILQYEKDVDEVSVLATNDDFDDDIIYLASIPEQMVILTGQNNDIKNLYNSFEKDLSDLHKIYNSGEAALGRFSFYEEHILLIEENFDGVDYTTNIKVVLPDESIKTLYTDLPGGYFDFQYTSIKNHFVIAAEENLIDGNSIIAYNLENNSIVPFTDIVPDFQECGLLTELSSFNGNIIHWNCETHYTYDLNTNQFLPYTDDSFFLYYDSEDFLYQGFNGGLYKVNKSTGDQELILDQTYTRIGSARAYCALKKNGDVVDFHYFNFEEGTLYTYPTNYPSDVFYRLAGFGIVPSGIHLILYESSEDNGIICKVNAESFTEIDSIFNVSFSNRPVAFGENIYFTHQHPEFGNELFVIDYSVSSTVDHNTPASIKVSPNPAMNYIQIEHSNGFTPLKTSIYDISGMLMKDNLNHDKINISNLPVGLYLLSTSYTNGKINVEKFIIKR